MNTNRNKKLALSRQSIRTLTVSELQVAHGGEGNTTGNGPQPGTCGHSHRTQKPPPPPPTVVKLA